MRYGGLGLCGPTNIAAAAAAGAIGQALTQMYHRNAWSWLPRDAAILRRLPTTAHYERCTRLVSDLAKIPRPHDDEHWGISQGHAKNVHFLMSGIRRIKDRDPWSPDGRDVDVRLPELLIERPAP